MEPYTTDTLTHGSPIGLRGHGAVHDRHIDASLLPDIAVLKDTGDTTAAVRTSPCILAELCAINVLDSLADRVLGCPDDLLEPAFDAVSRPFGKEGIRSGA